MSQKPALEAGLDPRARRLLAMMAAGRMKQQGVFDVAARRAGLRALARAAGEEPEAAGPQGEDSFLDVGPLTLQMRRYRAARGSGAAVLYLHGGGFVAGDLDTHDALCRRLCRAAAADVFALAYPLAPEHPFPTALDAVEHVLFHLAATALDLGVDPSRIAVAGDSAGGALAAAASLGVARLGLNLRAQLLICPILDLGGESASRRRFSHGYLVEKDAFEEDICAYVRPGADRGDPRLSPLRAADLKKTPPTLVHLAPYDPFHDEGFAYAERLKAAGVAAQTTTHAGMIHYFAALGGAIPAARAATDIMGAELGELLRR